MEILVENTTWMIYIDVYEIQKENIPEKEEEEEERQG